MTRSKSNEQLMIENAYLWIYSSRTGQMKKFDNIQIKQKINAYTGAPLNQYIARSEEGLDRLVSGLDSAIWYYAKYQEFLIWSQIDDDERIHNILIKMLRQRSFNRMRECLDILREEHKTLQIANANLLNSNCIVSIKNYNDVETVIQEYFYNL